MLIAWCSRAHDGGGCSGRRGFRGRGPGPGRPPGRRRRAGQEDERRDLQAGAIPAKVSENIRPIVTAGLANEVELVNQYAAPIYAPTAAADRAPRPVRASAKISAISPVVATTSDNRVGARERGEGGRPGTRPGRTSSFARHCTEETAPGSGGSVVGQGDRARPSPRPAFSSPATQCPVHRRHHGVEMCSGDRPEQQDQNPQARGRWRCCSPATADPRRWGTAAGRRSRIRPRPLGPGRLGADVVSASSRRASAGGADLTYCLIITSLIVSTETRSGGK